MNDMSSLETRNVGRDSLFLFAELTIDGHADPVRAKVRNLSAGGMMADGVDVAVSRGDRIVATLRNVGQVKGTVAWVQGTRFGIAFDNQVDPKLARAPIQTGGEAPRHSRPALDSSMFTDEERRLRNL